MGIENCIYIDTEGKWWVAKTDVLFGNGKITLIEEKTDKLKEIVPKEIVQNLDMTSPYILYLSNGKWRPIAATNRETHHK